MALALHNDIAKSERETLTALSFCWADLLLRLDSQFHVTYATGAFDVVVGQQSAALVGRPFSELFVAADAPEVAQLLRIINHRGRAEGDGLRLMHRAGLPLVVRFAGYCWRDEYYIGLRLHSSDPAAMPITFRREEATGLLAADAFAKVASRRIKDLGGKGKDMAMTVLFMPGLDILREGLSEQDAASLMQEVGAHLRANSLAKDTAAELNNGKFGLVHDVGIDITRLKDELVELSRSYSQDDSTIAISDSSMNLAGVENIGQEYLAKGLIYFVQQLQIKKGENFKLSDIANNVTDMCHLGLKKLADLRQAIRNENFSVAFQPIIDSRSGRIHHYEALCRFISSGSDESPYQNITFAEEVGLIHEFDLAMAKKVIGWVESKPRRSDRYHVAINVSGYSIGVEQYLDDLDALLAANQWSRGKIMFEITESSRMSDLPAANKFIQHLRGLGYKMCLDDFGAGAASFQYLSALDIDVVKIDGSAVRNAQSAPKGQAFLSALNELCERLSVETIAEMIDSPEALAFVRSCGCGYVQGYLFGKPHADVKAFDPLPGLAHFGAAAQ